MSKASPLVRLVEINDKKDVSFVPRVGGACFLIEHNSHGGKNRYYCAIPEKLIYDALADRMTPKRGSR